MSQSDDDMPLARVFGQQTQDGSESSELPSWIRDHQTPIKLDASSSSGEEEVQAAEPRTAGATATSQQQRAHSKAGTAATNQAPATTGTAAPVAVGAAAGAAAAAPAAVLPGVHRSEVQLILPEQLQRNKVLLELEPAAHGATDLSGDAGAVGRLLLPKGAESGDLTQLRSFLLDLKGVLYNSTVLPLAGTAMVVNIGPADARVESIMNDFVRLGEESSYLESGMLMEGAGAARVGDLLGSDDEHYLPDAAGAGGEDGDKAAAKPKAKKAAGAGAKGAGSSLKPRKAGVSKKGAGSSKKGGAGSAKKKPAAGGSSKKAASGKPPGSAKAAKTAAKPPAAKAKSKPKKPPGSGEDDLSSGATEESEPEWSEGSD